SRAGRVGPTCAARTLERSCAVRPGPAKLVRRVRCDSRRMPNAPVQFVRRSSSYFAQLLARQIYKDRFETRLRDGEVENLHAGGVGDVHDSWHETIAALHVHGDNVLHDARGNDALNLR